MQEDVAKSIQPFQANHGQMKMKWDEIMKNVNIVLGGKVLNSASCSCHFACLEETFCKDELASLYASGTEEEFVEQEQLLTDLAEL
ncbi:hypothetical protein HK096_006114, partial [Nowakowskiella sp. JEL0078]